MYAAGKQEEKIIKDLERVSYKLKGLRILKSYYSHCSSGLQEGFFYDIEHDIKIYKKPAEKRYKDKIESINSKIKGCKKEADFLSHRLQDTERDIELFNTTRRKIKLTNHE